MRQRPVKAALYVRLAPHEQPPESPELARLRAHASRRGWSAVEFIDRRRVGRKKKYERPQLEAALAAARSRQVGAVLCMRSDLAGSLHAPERLRAELEGLGVKLVVVEQHHDDSLSPEFHPRTLYADLLRRFRKCDAERRMPIGPLWLSEQQWRAAESEFVSRELAGTIALVRNRPKAILGGTPGSHAQQRQRQGLCRWKKDCAFLHLAAWAVDGAAETCLTAMRNALTPHAYDHAAFHYDQLKPPRPRGRTLQDPLRFFRYFYARLFQWLILHGEARASANGSRLDWQHLKARYGYLKEVDWERLPQRLLPGAGNTPRRNAQRDVATKFELQNEDVVPVLISRFRRGDYSLG